MQRYVQLVSVEGGLETDTTTTNTKTTTTTTSTTNTNTTATTTATTANNDNYLLTAYHLLPVTLDFYLR